MDREQRIRVVSRSQNDWIVSLVDIYLRGAVLCEEPVKPTYWASRFRRDAKL